MTQHRITEAGSSLHIPIKMHTLNINTNEIVKFTNKLEKLHKSDMPLAVRSTLNDAAFIGRKESLRQFRRNFILRKPEFIRSHNIVFKSQNTFNLRDMVSSFGIVRGKSKSGDDLVKQEFGGKLSGRDIPMDAARVGGTRKGLVNKRLYKKIWGNKKNGLIYKSGESRIIKTEKALMRVMRGGKWNVLFSLKRDVELSKKPFIFPAALIASKNINQLFIKNAQKRIKKRMSK